MCVCVCVFGCLSERDGGHGGGHSCVNDRYLCACMFVCVCVRACACVPAGECVLCV